MRLTETEYYQYLTIHHAMLLFAGQQQKLLPTDMGLGEFQGLNPSEKLDAREALYETPGIIQAFVKQNPLGFPKEDLDIALGFQNFVKGDFVVVKFLKKHTIFLQEDVAYGVLALSDPLSYLIGNETPKYVKAVLLPFNGKIVYDGILQGYSVSFGASYRLSINQQYNAAKAAYGIVTSLPFKKEKQEQAPEDKLAFYMKSAKNRKYYMYEIDDLLDRHPELEGKYYWHWGRINSREKKKSLKFLGIHDLHYAIIDDTIVAHAESARQIKEMVKAIIPKDKQDWVFYFNLK